MEVGQGPCGAGSQGSSLCRQSQGRRPRRPSKRTESSRASTAAPSHPSSESDKRKVHGVAGLTTVITREGVGQGHRTARKPPPPHVPAFFEVRRLSNSEKSSLIVPFKLLKRSKDPGGESGGDCRGPPLSCLPLPTWAGVGRHLCPLWGEPESQFEVGVVKHRLGLPGGQGGDQGRDSPCRVGCSDRSRGARKGVSPEEDTGLAAEAAAQGSAAFPVLGAGCCGAAQGSEPLGAECVPAPVGAPQGSTEAAGLAPVER